LVNTLERKGWVLKGGRGVKAPGAR